MQVTAIWTAPVLLYQRIWILTGKPVSEVRTDGLFCWLGWGPGTAPQCAQQTRAVLPDLNSDMGNWQWLFVYFSLFSFPCHRRSASHFYHSGVKLQCLHFCSLNPTWLSHPSSCWTLQWVCVGQFLLHLSLLAVPQSSGLHPASPLPLPLRF